VKIHANFTVPILNRKLRRTINIKEEIKMRRHRMHHNHNHNNGGVVPVYMMNNKQVHKKKVGEKAELNESQWGIGLFIGVLVAIPGSLLMILSPGIGSILALIVMGLGFIVALAVMTIDWATFGS
jgi:hypothetical protein